MRGATVDVNPKLIGKDWLIGVKFSFGQVAERSKAAARKGRYTVKGRIGGSNPSPVRQVD